MKTASFKQFPLQPGAINIARRAPKNYGPVASYPQLAPGPWFNSVSREEFDRRYRDEILNRLDPQKVWDDLKRLAGDAEPVLLCWEVPPFDRERNYCHRRQVAVWLERFTGEKILEIGFDQETYPEDRIMDVKGPALYLPGAAGEDVWPLPGGKQPGSNPKSVRPGERPATAPTPDYLRHPAPDGQAALLPDTWQALSIVTGLPAADLALWAAAKAQPPGSLPPVSETPELIRSLLTSLGFTPGAVPTSGASPTLGEVIQRHPGRVLLVRLYQGSHRLIAVKDGQYYADRSLVNEKVQGYWLKPAP